MKPGNRDRIENVAELVLLDAAGRPVPAQFTKLEKCEEARSSGRSATS